MSSPTRPFSLKGMRSSTSGREPSPALSLSSDSSGLISPTLSLPRSTRSSSLLPAAKGTAQLFGKECVMCHQVDLAYKEKGASKHEKPYQLGAQGGETSDGKESFQSFKDDLKNSSDLLDLKMFFRT